MTMRSTIPAKPRRGPKTGASQGTGINGSFLGSPKTLVRKPMIDAFQLELYQSTSPKTLRYWVRESKPVTSPERAIQVSHTMQKEMAALHSLRAAKNRKKAPKKSLMAARPPRRPPARARRPRRQEIQAIVRMKKGTSAHWLINRD
jgi:hypothetical protein